MTDYLFGTYINTIDSFLDQCGYTNWVHGGVTTDPNTETHHVEYTNNNNETDIAYSGMDVDCICVSGHVFLDINTFGTNTKSLSLYEFDALRERLPKLFPDRNSLKKSVT